MSGYVKVAGVWLAVSLTILVAMKVQPSGTQAYGWMDDDGGSCEHFASPAEYDDAKACGTLAALDAILEPGETGRVKAGVYPPQSAGSRDRFAPVKIIGEDGTSIDSGTAHNSGLALGGNIDVANIDVGGNTPFVFVGGIRSTWRDSRLLEGASGALARSCINNDAEPLIIYAAPDEPQVRDVALVNVVIEEQHHAPTDTCIGGGLYHLELGRIDLNVTRITLDSVTFADCPECGSGLLFITTNSTLSPAPSQLTMKNVVFGESPLYSFQVNENVTHCEDWTIAYSTFTQEAYVPCADADIRWIGNLMPRAASAPCYGVYTKNVTQAEFDNRYCEDVDGEVSDIWVPGPNYSTSNLGIGADFTLEAGSPAIDAAESGAGSYCLGKLGAVDRLGGSRPVGAACDAGADERA